MLNLEEAIPPCDWGMREQRVVHCDIYMFIVIYIYVHGKKALAPLYHPSRSQYPAMYLKYLTYPIPTPPFRYIHTYAYIHIYIYTHARTQNSSSWPSSDAVSGYDGGQFGRVEDIHSTYN